MIKAINVSYRYSKGEEVLRNINLNIKEGTITALIGSNGSGKSTLLKLISKTNEKHLKYDGKIELIDENIKNMEYKKVSQIVGLLEQRNEFSDSISDSINIEKFIVFGKYNRKNLFENYTEKDYLEVNKIMAELKIDNLYGRETSQLSGGELQKVFIAKILVQDTPV
ncbi:MAG: ABC transporter ATP-binding protein, partial [Leptotrichiaceae bacterium]